MYGQMTAGSWIYIGTQGIVQGTYETFAEAGRQHYEGDLKGKWILTAGLGGMGEPSHLLQYSRVPVVWRSSAMNRESTFDCARAISMRKPPRWTKRSR